MIQVSRKNYLERNEDKEGLFAAQKALERDKYLVETFNLNSLKSNSTRINYLENLYTIDLLDRHLDIDFKDQVSVLDIGCKNWFYAKGEYFFFKKYCNSLKLDGVELDSRRLYTNLYSRGEVAKFHIKDLKNTNYLSKDFLNHSEKYDYIVWILPFVFDSPLLKWGLPQKYFKPEKMLSHAYESLNEGGKIFIINQGEAEYEAQKELCEKLNIKYDDIGKIESDFLDFNYSRYSRYLIVIKN